MTFKFTDFFLKKIFSLSICQETVFCSSRIQFAPITQFFFLCDSSDETRLQAEVGKV